MRFFAIFLLSVLMSGCSTVTIEDRLGSDDIFVGMTKQQLFKKYYWQGGQYAHPFSVSSHRSFFPNNNIEIIIPTI